MRCVNTAERGKRKEKKEKKIDIFRINLLSSADLVLTLLWQAGFIEKKNRPMEHRVTLWRDCILDTDFSFQPLFSHPRLLPWDM